MKGLILSAMVSPASKLQLKSPATTHSMLILDQLVVTVASEEVVELMKKKCLPILYYAIEVYPLNKAYIIIPWILQ